MYNMGKQITVIGLGAGDLDQLPLGVYKKLKAVDQVFIRTKEHPVIQDLENEGVAFTGFDSVYEDHDDFESVYKEIVEKLLEAAKHEEVYYAVPGHPLVAESTVQLLIELERSGEVQLTIAGGQSFLDPMFSALKMDPIDGFQLLDGTNLDREKVEIRQHLIIAQVYDSFIASEVKLTLMEKLPDEYEVTVVTAAGTEQESVVTVPLYELDRVTTLSNLTAVYVPPITDDKLLYREFSKLRQVIAALRGPNGCPWDKEQTHHSLKKYLIEEAYEVLEAIDEEDGDHLAEELGDVLLQVLLHAQIGEDDGFFQIEDVIEILTEKMIRRHPHVFSNAEADNSEKVVTQWEEIKKQEKGRNEEGFHSILSGIPNGLPSLAYALKLQKKAAKVGFDWDDDAPMWKKLQEEIEEWLHELKEGNKEAAENELGDILFVMVNLARYHGIEPEEALRQTNKKFTKRFHFIEKTLYELGEKLEDQPLKKLDALWEKAKLEE